MTSIFDEGGKLIPCTIIEAGPCVVTHIKTRETDGYTAIQMGFGYAKEKNTAKPQKGHYARAKVDPCAKLVEFRRPFALASIRATSLYNLRVNCRCSCLLREAP